MQGNESANRPFFTSDVLKQYRFVKDKWEGGLRFYREAPAEEWVGGSCVDRICGRILIVRVDVKTTNRTFRTSRSKGAAPG